MSKAAYPNFGRYNPRVNTDNQNYGRYDPNAASLEKYDGTVSTLAIYCAEYSNLMPKDWEDEKITYTQANTNYAINILKIYARDPKECNHHVASYCGLYIFRHGKKLGYECGDNHVVIEFNDCKVRFCTKTGLRCERDYRNDDDCTSLSGWWIVLTPFLLVFVLIVIALGRR